LKNIDCFSEIDEIWGKNLNLRGFSNLNSIPELLGFGSKNPAVLLVDR
jgi:hypothetical protein